MPRPGGAAEDPTSVPVVTPVPGKPLDLDAIVTRPPLHPWVEGDNIPWDEPGFSERMLREHLSQDHDLASRRGEIIEGQVRVIAGLLPRPSGCRVLDLTCGPGLYAHRLARLGHVCHGVDFSPAAIRHAREITAAEGLACTFSEGDVREAELGSDYDLALLLYGQVNVFPRDQAADILRRTFEALVPFGRAVLEAQTFETVRRLGDPPPTWSASRSGLFSEAPHLLLEERAWDEASRTATERWYVIDAATSTVRRYAMSTTAYTEDELAGLLREAGFTEVERRGSLGPDGDRSLFVLIGSKPGYPLYR
jgi:SAM-dependent methyltransferase